jgi:hypothetical protein
MEYSASDYGDSDFLADNDRSIRDFRENEKASKKEIVKQMVKLRHNLQYNKHLLSVYLKAKTIFDEMVEEHRAQIHHLDEIYRHLSKMIHTELTRHKSSSKKRRDGGVVDNNKPMIKELVKDKRKIGKLLSNMRKGLDKLMEIDTIIGTTIEKINEIQFIEDDAAESEDSEANEEDDDAEASEDDDDDADDDEAEANEEDDDEAEESEESEDSEDDDEDEAEEDDDSASEASEEDDDSDDEEAEAEDDEESEDEEDDEDEDEEDDDSASAEEDDEAEEDDDEDDDEADEDEAVVFY